MIRAVLDSALWEEGAPPSRPRAVIFDWDNTLVETWPSIHRALELTFVEFGMVPWTLEETKQRVRTSMRDSFPPLFGERWEDAALFFNKAVTEIHLEKLLPMPGAEEMLAELAGAGIYLGVVSNKNGDLLRAEAAHLGWEKYFGRIVGAFDAKKDKPASDPVYLSLSESDISCGHDVWFAGDTDIDMECAVRSDCLPVLIRSEPPCNGEFDEFKPALYFNVCLALSNLIRRL